MRQLAVRTTLIFAALTAGLTWAGAPARAQDEGKLTTAIAKLADDIRAYLDDAGATSCSIGQFLTIPPNGEVTTLPLKERLTQELTNRNITVQRRGANFSCTGEVRFNRTSKKLELEVKIHESSIFRKTCTAEIFQVADLARLVGPTGQLAVDETRNQTIETSITNPTPDVVESPPLENAKKATPAVAKSKAGIGVPARPVAATKSLAKAGKTGLFGVEILRVLPGNVFEPIALEEEPDGKLFASLEVGDTYAVRLLNKSDKIAGASLTIDGLNMLTFSDNADYKRIGRVIVPPGETGALIRGWHKSDAECYTFTVVDVGQAAVTELKGAGGVLEVDDAVGIITATFCFATDATNVASRLPDDEATDLQTGTGRGPVIKQNYKPFRAIFGADREVISIRYDRLPPGNG